jgi:hypothetical protein
VPPAGVVDPDAAGFPLGVLDEPELSEPLEPVSVELVAPDASDDPLEAAAGRLVDDRSFFAQPLPLNTIDGAEIALRTPPLWQTGQWLGPSAWTPWITSNRWPQ